MGRRLLWDVIPCQVRVTGDGEEQVFENARAVVCDDIALLYTSRGGRIELTKGGPGSREEVLTLEPPLRAGASYGVVLASGERWTILKTGSCGCRSVLRNAPIARDIQD